MNHTCHIKGSLHCEVIAATTAYLLVVTHNAQFCLPELQSVLSYAVAQLLSYLAHIRHRGVSPVAMSHHQIRHVGHIAKIGLNAVFSKECTYLVATLPVSLMCSQQASQIARFVYQYLGSQLLFLEFLTSLSHQLCYLAVCCGRSFLLRS